MFKKTEPVWDELNLYRRIVETAQEGIWVLDSENKTIFVNKIMAEMLGHLVEEMLGMPLLDFMDEEGKTIAATYVASRSQGIKEQYDLRFRRKDGSDLWAIVDTNSFFDEKGNYTGSLAMVTDITARRQAEDLLRRSEERFQFAMDAAQDGIWDWNIASGVVYYSPSYFSMLGYTEGRFPPTVQTWLDLIHPDDQAKTLAANNECIENHTERFEVEFRMLTRDGQWKWILGKGKAVERDAQGRAIRIVGTHTDINERRQAEQILQSRLRLVEASFSKNMDKLLQATLDEAELLTGSQIGFFHFMEADQNMLSLQTWSTRTLEVFCKAEGKGLHYSMDQAGVWADCVRERRPVIYNDYASLSFQRGLPVGHAEVRRILTIPIMRGDKVVAIFGVGNKTGDYLQQDVEVVSIISDMAWDIAERKLSEEQVREANKRLEEQLGEIKILQGYLREQATRDALTGLYNRHYLHETMGHELSRASREGYMVSILMVDIDYFKEFNDTHGHQAGDEILVALGKLLGSGFRRGDIACRYGGEEFIIIMPGVSIQTADKRAEEMRTDFEKVCVHYGGADLFSTISIGVACYPTHGEDMSKIIKAADAALYEAKQSGRNCIRVWKEK